MPRIGREFRKKSIVQETQHKIIMKFTLFLSLITLGFLLTNCQPQDEVAPGTIDNVAAINASELPTEAQQFINDNFSAQFITEAYRINTTGSTSFETLLTNEANLVFNANGNLTGFGDANGQVAFGTEGRGQRRQGNNGKATEIDGAPLPAAITDYITLHYTDADMLKAFSPALETTPATTETHVLVAETGILIFDSENNFVMVREQRHRDGRGRDRDRDERDENDETEEVAVPIDQLPEAITTYIATWYPDNLIIEAELKTRDSVSRYHVEVEAVGTLVFDIDGNFIKEKQEREDNDEDRPAVEEIEQSQLPTTVSDYIATWYPEAIIEKAVTITFEDGTVHYGVKLLNGTRLRFDDAGNVLT